MILFMILLFNYEILCPFYQRIKKGKFAIFKIKMKAIEE